MLWGSSSPKRPTPTMNKAYKGAGTPFPESSALFLFWKPMIASLLALCPAKPPQILCLWFRPNHVKLFLIQVSHVEALNKIQPIFISSWPVTQPRPVRVRYIRSNRRNAESIKHHAYCQNSLNFTSQLKVLGTGSHRIVAACLWNTNDIKNGDFLHGAEDSGKSAPDRLTS